MGLAPIPANSTLYIGHGRGWQDKATSVLSPLWAVTLGARKSPYGKRVTPSTTDSAPEDPLPHTALTLVNDALCDEFALPPLIITQWPPAENQAVPEVLLKAKEVLGGSRHSRDTRGLGWSNLVLGLGKISISRDS